MDGRKAPRRYENSKTQLQRTPIYVIFSGRSKEKKVQFNSQGEYRISFRALIGHK